MQNNPDNLSQQENIRLIFDIIHRAAFHHVMWFAEVSEHLGKEKALEILGKVYKQTTAIQTKRLSKTFGIEMNDELPSNLINLPVEKLNELRESLAINWLANDGVWFQAVEFSIGMDNAKHCNDSCWAKFSPFEAWSIKQFLELPEFPGLEGLKQSLRFRLYAFINTQSVVDEMTDSFIFRMNDCRVQSARKRKGLPDYPCKSAGMIEFPEFAKAIDSRIKTACVCCPPDVHPNTHFCAWRFYL
ncbi:MAG: cytosolic protein [Bacteroidetes bacterium CG23_combo_of_CG06-09_8_20_14_all_32_9]|nr:MAG: cytosolic protein [Bacteroidetes bacterium CG23_combo_of_CG06-09_8_20_14_all_32_9]